MDILFAANLVIIVAMAQQLYRRQPALRRVFWPALLAKLVAGICLGLVYTYYYPVSDTFIYFSDALQLVSLARQDFGAYVEFLAFTSEPASLQLALPEPRALLLTKITSIFSLLTGNNYWTISLYFSFISFLSSWFFVRTLCHFLPGAATAAVVAILFLPSATFWTSGLLKESLAIAALFYPCALILKVWFSDRMRWHHFVLGLLSLWILWNLKYFYVGIFLPVAITTLLYRSTIHKRYAMSAGAELAIWLLILIIPLVLISFMHPNFHFDRVADVLVKNNAAYVRQSDPGDFVRFHNLTPDVPGILINAPWALFSGLFRPLLWEAVSLPQIVAGVENIFLLLFFAVSLLTAGSYRSEPHRLLILAIIVYIILLSVFITISAPNFGTLSRYRVGYISFFAFLILNKNPLTQYVERSITRLVRK